MILHRRRITGLVIAVALLGSTASGQEYKALQHTMNWLIDRGERLDSTRNQILFSYAHPIFWAPFSLIGDGGGRATAR